MPTAIIIGASSGIGHALARELDAHGYQLAITARRKDRLDDLAASLTQPTIVQTMDVSQPEEAITQLQILFAQLAEVDLVILNAGIGHLDFDLNWTDDRALIQTNVAGFSALAGETYRYFKRHNRGHLVGVSSILSLRGGAAVTYSASKAYMANYLQGLRFLIARQKLNIKVTDIKPGFVDTAIVKGKTFWMVSPERAAKSIYTAIRKQKKVAYITARWRLIAWLSAILPDWLYHRI